MLLLANAEAVLGAEYGVPTPDRGSQRNCYRTKPSDTRLDTIDAHAPKLRSGTYFPESLVERRQRSESPLVTVVADCYWAGVSTRRMDKLVKTLGVHSSPNRKYPEWLSSLMSMSPKFRHRGLDGAGPFAPAAADGWSMKVREEVGR